MKVIERAVMPNGTRIQIEDWSKDYSFHTYADMVASYPLSKKSHYGDFAPKENEPYRFAFLFASAESARDAFDQLKSGSKELSDYADRMTGNKEYINCL